MLNISTYIISCIILITWYSRTEYVILSCDLVFLWLCYMTVTHPGHLMFIIYMSHYACTVSLYMIYRLDYSYYCCYFQFPIMLIILFLLFQYLICAVTTFFIFFFYCPFVYSYWYASDGLYYFSVSRSENRYREFIVDPIMVQPHFGELVSLSWLVLFRYGGWYWLWFYASYMCFYPCAWLYMHICLLSCSLLTA